MKTALLLYPNQLYAAQHLPADVDEVVLVEEPLLFGTDEQYKLYVHKQKLAFMRATMRRYVEEELWPAGFQVDYIEFSKLQTSGDIVEKLKEFELVHVFEFNDDILSRRLVSALNAHPDAPQLSVLMSPSFFLNAQESDEFFKDPKSSQFPKFYQWQRERFNILIDQETYKPLEGKWDFKAPARKRVPKGTELASFQIYGSNDFVVEAVEYVEKHFSDNPGLLADFPWPTSRSEAQKWLADFLESRLEKYAVYHEAIDGQAPWLFHSAVAPLLNSGLLQPDEVVSAAIAAHKKQNGDIENVETFVRNILGWREYARGVYRKRNVVLRTANSFQHERKMTIDWYRGTTGIPPVDDIIKKILTRSYTHEVERVMVLGNIMFLCEFHPDEVYRWFMEMFIDSYDWAVVPRVYGVSQGAAFTQLGTTPAISSSNFILNMSHYEKGVWSDVWDGLYWRGIEKHRDKFASHPDFKMAVSQLDKISPNRRRIIGYRAEDFLKEKTE